MAGSLKPSLGGAFASLIEAALAPVADDLATLNQLLPGYIPTESNSARAVCDHVMGAGGKRIRPALFFMCARLLDYRGADYFPIAAVAELVHTASLLHDDVVDDSTLRRGKPTANSVYGDETSVLCGDLIYSTASEMMASTNNMEIVRTFARAIRLMSDGELMQLENLYNPAITQATYFRILECKTAVLIEAACKSAALLAGASNEVVQALSQFGYSVGMAFQLIDDALDYSGIAEIVGKPTLSDLAEGKVTLPVILMRAEASLAEQTLFAEGLAAKLNGAARKGPEYVQRMAELVEHYDTARRTIDKASEYTEAAFAALRIFPDSEAKAVLMRLAETLLIRFH